MPLNRKKLAVIAGLALLGLLAGTLIFLRLSPQLLMVAHPVQPVDCLIVLGGDNGPRSTRAAELYREGLAPLVLITGEGDAETIRLMLQHGGVPTNRILVEDRSTSTYENAAYSIPILKSNQVRQAGLVTSWFHSRRSLACFRKVAPEIEFYSFPSTEDLPENWPSLLYSRWIVYEYAKILLYPMLHGVVSW